MDAAIKKTLSYFAQFHYAPSIEELHEFLGKKITRSALEKQLFELKKKKAVCESTDRYTLGEYSIFLTTYVKKWHESERKKMTISHYVDILSKLPFIKLIGYSGTVAMHNAKLGDDIDLFIISARGRVWTARFAALILAQLLGVRRHRLVKKAKDKVCLNLFFDQNDLVISPQKRTEYVAHEVLQMKPIINKEKIYEEFLRENNWALTFFPNAKNYHKTAFNSENMTKQSTYMENIFANAVETILRHLQFWFMKNHITSEKISKTQLWFFPKDFEKKLGQKKNAG